ncbi:MAG TPA: fibronectin type III domain-containing protein [Candidatus Baltobacteraceae bacterium]|nr:fibronectin type III domain-containing protein [Candidatus Baltobacteraceae bacterium]
MKRHKLNFGNRTILEQIAICRRVSDGIAKLPDEDRKQLSKPDVARKTDEAAAACAEVESLKTQLRAALTRRNQKVRAAREAATNAAAGIRGLTGGDAAAMLAAGLGVAKDRQPVGKPDAPGNVRVLPTDFDGAARLRWKRPVRRCSFAVQATTAPMAQRGWKHQLTCFKQSCLVTGLKSGKYWFRVSASNAHGQGPWSQPVSAWVK